MSRNSAQATTASVFVRNLKTLGFEPPMDSKWVVNEKTFTVNVHRIKAFEYISHFLFQLLDENKAKTTFIGVWPIQNIQQSQEYRRRAFQWLKEIQPGTSLMYVPLRKSYFTACIGEPFNKIVSAFTTVVLDNQKSNQTKDNHEANASSAHDSEPTTAGKRSTVHRPPSKEVIHQKKTRPNIPDTVTVSSPRVGSYQTTPNTIGQQPFASTSFSFTSPTQLLNCQLSSIPFSSLHNPTSSFSFLKATSPPSSPETHPCKGLSSFLNSLAYQAVSFDNFIKERKRKNNILTEEHALQERECFEKEVLERNRILQEEYVKQIDLEDHHLVSRTIVDGTGLDGKEGSIQHSKKLPKEFTEKAELCPKKAEVVEKAEAEVVKKVEAEAVEKAEAEAVEKKDAEAVKKNDAEAVNKNEAKVPKNAGADTVKETEAETAKKAKEVKAEKNAEAEALNKADAYASKKEVEAAKAKKIRQLLVPKSIGQLKMLVLEKKLEDEWKAEELKEVVEEEEEKKKKTEAARAEMRKLKQEEADKKRMAAAVKLEREREDKSIAETALKAQRMREEVERLEREVKEKVESQRIKRELEAQEAEKFKVYLNEVQVNYEKKRAEEDRCTVFKLKLTKEREDIQAELTEAEKVLSFKEKAVVEKDEDESDEDYAVDQRQDLPTSVFSPEEESAHRVGVSNPEPTPEKYSGVSSLLGDIPSLPDCDESFKPFESDSFAIEENDELCVDGSADFIVSATIRSPSPMPQEKNSVCSVTSKEDLPAPNLFLEASSSNRQSESAKRLYEFKKALGGSSGRDLSDFEPIPTRPRRLFSLKQLEYAALPRRL